MKSANFNDENFIVSKQIKLQKRGLILFPFVAILFIMMALNDYNGKMFIFIISFFLLYIFLIFVYSPLSKGTILGEIFYKVEILNGNGIRFTTFGTLWRSEKKILADLKDIKVDKRPLPKLLYKKYLLNALYIQDKKYYIFNTVLLESGIAD